MKKQKSLSGINTPSTEPLVSEKAWLRLFKQTHQSGTVTYCISCRSYTLWSNILQKINSSTLFFCWPFLKLTNKPNCCFLGPFTTHHCRSRPWWDFVTQITVLEFYGRKEFHPVDEYDGHVREHKNKEKTTEGKQVSTLLLWCPVWLQAAILTPCF